MTGRFITFEGADGSGKSTQARLLAEALRRDGHTVIETREPGGTPLGEGIRALLLDGDAIDPVSEALLFAAARAQHVRELIRPALERGDWVVCDRFLDSSIAYQGIARGLGADVIDAVNAPAIDGLRPDLTIVLDVPVAVTIERRSGGPVDRIESEGDGFQRTVADAFHDLARRSPERITIVPGDASEEAVHAAVMDAVESMT